MHRVPVLLALLAAPAVRAAAAGTDVRMPVCRAATAFLLEAPSFILLAGKKAASGPDDAPFARLMKYTTPSASEKDAHLRAFCEGVLKNHPAGAAFDLAAAVNLILDKVRDGAGIPPPFATQSGSRPVSWLINSPHNGESSLEPIVRRAIGSNARDWSRCRFPENPLIKLGISGASGPLKMAGLRSLRIAELADAVFVAKAIYAHGTLYRTQGAAEGLGVKTEAFQDALDLCPATLQAPTFIYVLLQRELPPAGPAAPPAAGGSLLRPVAGEPLFGPVVLHPRRDPATHRNMAVVVAAATVVLLLAAAIATLLDAEPASVPDERDDLFDLK
jgi:hypothetical protein